MSATHRLLRFGVFELNLDTQELRKFGTRLSLRPQPFRLLALLASCSGQVVSRDEIKNQLWGEDTYVDFEHGMNKCIKQIRTVLGDDSNKPVYIETIPRQGYRFLVPVTAKTVLAPPARVRESSSGIPPDLAELIRLRMAARKANAMAGQAPASVEAVATKDTTAPILTPVADEVLELAPEPDAPPQARTTPWIPVAAIIAAVLLALALYWFFRR